MHRLLARQIAKATDGTGQLDQDRLFELVSAAYRRLGEARARSARSKAAPGGDHQAEGGRTALDRLARENRVMEAALAHMVQGVAIFDADKRLLVSNVRYAEIYDFPAHLLRRGTHFSDLVAFRLSQNFYAGEHPAEYRPDRLHDALGVRDSVHCFRDGR